MLVLTRNSAIARSQEKPRQWGPLSAVQSAVRWNAERLGLPAPAAVWPYWERAGQPRNVMYGALDSVSGGPTWTGDGLNTTASAWHNTGTTINTLAPIGFSLVVEMRFNSGNFNANNFHFGQYDQTSIAYNCGLYGYDGAELRWYYVNGSHVVVATTGPFEQADFSVAITWDGATVRSYLNTVTGGAAATASHGGAGYNLRFGGSWTNKVDPYLRRFNHAMLFAQAISATQIAVLHKRPYQLLQPYAPPLYFDLAAGGGPVVPALDEGMLMGGFMPMAGGLC